MSGQNSVGFSDSESRLKAQGRAWDSLDENDIAVENAKVRRPVDESILSPKNECASLG
jgi:hypothetical protein